MGLRKHLVSEHWEESTPLPIKQKIQTNKQTNKAQSQRFPSYLINPVFDKSMKAKVTILAKMKLCSLYIIVVTHYRHEQVSLMMIIAFHLLDNFLYIERILKASY